MKKREREREREREKERERERERERVEKIKMAEWIRLEEKREVGKEK